MRRRLILLLVLPLAVALSACGSTASSSGTDPAAAVPAGVPVYVEVTLRPQGDLRTGALAAAGKVLGTSDPGSRIRELLQQAGQSGRDKVDFAREIEPWLGDRAGFWVAGPGLHKDGATASSGTGAYFGSSAVWDDARVGFVVAVRDEAAARRSLDAILARQGARLTTKTASGREYEVDTHGSAFAVTDGYAIVATTEAELRRSLAALDGDGLAGEDRYKGAIDALRQDRLGHYFVDVKSLVDTALAADFKAGMQLGPLQGLLTARMTPQAGSFSADGDRLVLESVTSGGGGIAATLGAAGLGEASPLLKQLPEAWGALAVPKVGASLRTVFGQVAGVLGGTAVTGRLRQKYGIDLEQDVFAWMGDVGVFARGTRPATVDGALVIEATDEAKAASAFGKAIGLLRTQAGRDPQPVKVAGADSAFAVRFPDSLNQPLVLARGGGRVVVAVGAAAAEAALGAGGREGDGAAYAAALKALDGYDPAGFVSVPSALALADAGGASADAGFQKAKPYLERFSAVAAGAKRDGDATRSRVAVGLK